MIKPITEKEWSCKPATLCNFLMLFSDTYYWKQFCSRYFVKFLTKSSYKILLPNYNQERANQELHKNYTEVKFFQNQISYILSTLYCCSKVEFLCKVDIRLRHTFFHNSNSSRCHLFQGLYYSITILFYLVCTLNIIIWYSSQIYHIVIYTVDFFAHGMPEKFAIK